MKIELGRLQTLLFGATIITMIACDTPSSDQAHDSQAAGSDCRDDPAAIIDRETLVEWLEGTHAGTVKDDEVDNEGVETIVCGHADASFELTLQLVGEVQCLEDNRQRVDIAGTLEIGEETTFGVGGHLELNVHTLGNELVLALNHKSSYPHGSFETRPEGLLIDESIDRISWSMRHSASNADVPVWENCILEFESGW